MEAFQRHGTMDSYTAQIRHHASFRTWISCASRRSLSGLCQWILLSQLMVTLSPGNRINPICSAVMLGVCACHTTSISFASRRSSLDSCQRTILSQLMGILQQRLWQCMEVKIECADCVIAMATAAVEGLHMCSTSTYYNANDRI